MRYAIALLALPFVLGIAGCGADDEDGSAADQAAFVGVPWVLTGLDVEGWEATPPSVTFTDDTLGGSTGCNRFTAPYTVDGETLELGKIATTRMACPPPAGDVERAYLDLLGRVTAWRMDGESLVLLDADDAELLRYDPASLMGDWEATAIQTGSALASPLPGTRITASFDAAGTLTGSSGCNSYRALYTIGRGAIEIEPPAATERACTSPEGVMDQETAYLAALPTAVSYRVEGGSLALLSADGTYVASYVRAGPR